MEILNYEIMCDKYVFVIALLFECWKDYDRGDFIETFEINDPVSALFYLPVENVDGVEIEGANGYVFPEYNVCDFTYSSICAGIRFDLRGNEELYRQIDNGEVNSISFGFRVLGEEWENVDSEKPHRIIKRISEICKIRFENQR